MPVLNSILLPLLLLQLPEGRDELDRSIELLDRADSIFVSIDYDAVELRDVVDDLERRIPIPLRADWQALNRLVVADFNRVSLSLHAASALTALEAIAMQLGDEFERPVVETHAGHLVLTTAAATASMREMDVYDVRDLLTGDELLEELRATAPSRSGESEAELGPEPQPRPEPAQSDEGAAPEDKPGGDAPTDPEPHPQAPDVEKLMKLTEEAASAPLTPGRELMLLLIDHVIPDAWTLAGGSRAEIGERDGVLLVSAPPSVHRALRRALRRLREANPSSITIDAAVVQLPRTHFDRLARRDDLLSAALAEAILASDATVTLWRGGSAVAIDQSLALETSSGRTEISLRIDPSQNPQRKTVRLEVQFRMKREGEERMLSTTIDAPQRDGAATLEFPSAELSETMTFLIINHRRV